MHTTEKNNLSGEKKIIYVVSALLLLSFIFLGFSEKKQTDPAGKTGWWAVYFENPKSPNLTFTIENNGKTKKFHWKEIAEDNTIVEGADISVPTGQKNTIPLVDATVPKGAKIIIEVSDEAGGKKEIYKTLN
ncbi:MAG: hypothetical protein NTY33_03710 [Candidatus Moranbacteria bacterium]|nr:hypothetical protein [Candidatus Moranbacteria bacterium]